MHRSSEIAIFALGTFWEPAYALAKLSGVARVEAGYAGGTSDKPSHHTIGDHTEAVRVEFDPHMIGYEDLLEAFWCLHDPNADAEHRFRSIIFYLDETQRASAARSKQIREAELGRPILTEILPATTFHAAEGFNQHYVARMRGEKK